MQSLWISEIPALARAGRTSNTLVGEAQNCSLIDYNDRYLGFVKILYDVPEYLHPPKVYRYNMDADGLQDNGTLRTRFNGRNAVAEGANPIIDFSTGTWSAPLDSWTKSSETATTTAGSFTTDQRYEIKSVGTTDFTLIGASSNTVGVHFTATGAGSGTGTASEAIRWTENSASSDLFVGKKYRIEVSGTTAWTSVGAGATTVGTIFTATADISGTGEAIQIAQDGDFIVGCWYKIDTLGTTDFTTIGAASNTVGVMFQATGTTPGGTGVAVVTRGARLGDLTTCSATNGGTTYQQIYASVYDYKDTGANQLVLIESEDAFDTLDTIVEVTSGGGNFGSTVADVVQRPGTETLYMFHGAAHASRGFYKVVSTSTDRGRTWTATGSEIPLSNDTESPRYYGIPVGKVAYETTTTVWFSAPCSQDKADKPEANLIFYATWADLDAGIDLTLWDFAPTIQRDPVASGVWNCDSIWLPDGSGFALCNVFRRDNYDDINSDEVKELRDNDQYHEMGAGSHKHVAVAATVNTLAITNPTYRPFADGDKLRFEFGGRYLAAASATNGANLILTTDKTDPNTVFVAKKQGEVWWQFRLFADSSLALSTGGNGVYANNRAENLPFEFHDWSNAISGDEDNFRFNVKLIGGNNTKSCYLENCRSSLAISRDCSQRRLFWNDPAKVWSIEVVA